MQISSCVDLVITPSKCGVDLVISRTRKTVVMTRGCSAYWDHGSAGFGLSASNFPVLRLGVRSRGCVLFCGYSIRKLSRAGWELQSCRWPPTHTKKDFNRRRNQIGGKQSGQLSECDTTRTAFRVDRQRQRVSRFLTNLLRVVVGTFFEPQKCRSDHPRPILCRVIDSLMEYLVGTAPSAAMNHAFRSWDPG